MIAPSREGIAEKVFMFRLNCDCIIVYAFSDDKHGGNKTKMEIWRISLSCPNAAQMNDTHEMQ